MRLPIRVRLTLAYAASSAVVLAALGAFIFGLVSRDLTASTDLGLRSRAQAVVNTIARQDYGVATSGGSLNDNDEAFTQVIDGNGTVIAASSHGSGVSSVLSPASLHGMSEPTFFIRRLPAVDSDPMRLLAVPATIDQKPGAVVVGATLGDRQDALHVLMIALFIGGPVALVITSTLAWAVAGRGLRPVETMRREATAISSSDPDRRLAVPATTDELSRLAETLNGLLDRQQQALARERRFVDDASHELRTPLSILKAELDLALARPRTVAELEGAVRAAATETDRLVALAEDLLVLARLHDGRLPLQRQTVSLAPLFATIEAAYGARAAAVGVHVNVGATPDEVFIDPIRVRQAVENLIDNALRVTPPGGTVDVRGYRIGDTVNVVADDTGPGFPNEFLADAFEPFTSARRDQEGNAGAGLGLAIVRAVAEAHGGLVEAKNRPNGGARILLTLPAASDARQPVTAPFSPS